MRILDGLFLACSVFALVFVLVTPHAPQWGWRLGLVTVSVVVLAVLWHARRRRPASSKVLTIPFVAVGLVASFASDGLTALPLLFVGLVLVVLEFGDRAGLGAVVVVAGAQAAAMTVLGSTPDNTAYQVTGTVSILAFVLAFGALLRRSEVDRVARMELLAQRDEANAALVAANARLRSSIDTEKELVLADERARSSRELHDGLGHRLTVARMSLDFAERARGTDPDAAWDEVTQARRVVEEALAEMRLWVRALNPVRVSGLTDPAAFEAIADAFRGTGVDVRIRVTGRERPLPEDVALFCYRLVQEGLTNALRHAHAGRVDLDVVFPDADTTDAINASDASGEVVSLRLVDDGRRTVGEEPHREVLTDDSEVPHGFGLRSLQERATALGGTLHARQGQHGFELAATVPLHRVEEGLMVR